LTAGNSLARAAAWRQWVAAQREGARAHRDDPPGAGREPSDLAGDFGCQEEVPVRRAGDEEGVDVTGAEILEDDVRAEAVTGCGDDVPPAERGHPRDVVVALLVGHREHLQRANDIKEADAVERHDHDLARVLRTIGGVDHAPIVERGDPLCNAVEPSDPDSDVHNRGARCRDGQIRA
jgi:hypothetical protein